MARLPAEPIAVPVLRSELTDDERRQLARFRLHQGHALVAGVVAAVAVCAAAILPARVASPSPRSSTLAWRVCADDEHGRFVALYGRAHGCDLGSDEAIDADALAACVTPLAGHRRAWALCTIGTGALDAAFSGASLSVPPSSSSSSVPGWPASFAEARGYVPGDTFAPAAAQLPRRMDRLEGVWVEGRVGDGTVAAAGRAASVGSLNAALIDAGAVIAQSWPGYTWVRLRVDPAHCDQAIARLERSSALFGVRVQDGLCPARRR